MAAKYQHRARDDDSSSSSESSYEDDGAMASGDKRYRARPVTTAAVAAAPTAAAAPMDMSHFATAFESVGKFMDMMKQTALSVQEKTSMTALAAKESAAAGGKLVAASSSTGVVKPAASFACRLTAELSASGKARDFVGRDGLPRIELPLSLGQFKAADTTLLAGLIAGTRKAFAVRAVLEGQASRSMGFRVKLEGLVPEATVKAHLASAYQVPDTEHTYERMLLHGKKVDEATGEPLLQDGHVYEWSAREIARSNGHFAALFCDLTKDESIKPLIESTGGLYLAGQPMYFAHDGKFHFPLGGPYATCYEAVEQTYVNPETGARPTHTKAGNLLQTSEAEIARDAIEQTDAGLARLLLPLRVESATAPFAKLVFTPTEKTDVRFFGADGNKDIKIGGKLSLDIVPCTLSAAAAAAGKA